MLCTLASVVHRGATDFGESPELHKEVEKLKERKTQLIELENQIDQQCCKIVQCLRNIVDDPDSNKYPLLLENTVKNILMFLFLNSDITLAFVTYEDIRRLDMFKGESRYSPLYFGFTTTSL